MVPTRHLVGMEYGCTLSENDLRGVTMEVTVSRLLSHHDSFLNLAFDSEKEWVRGRLGDQADVDLNGMHSAGRHLLPIG